MFDQYSYLYVEDDPLSQEIMRMIMAHGMGVENLMIFDNSQDFMKRTLGLNPKPEIIMLDIHISPLDGFEMLSLLRSNRDFRETKIIALTASVMNEEVEKLRRAGFDGAIAKPLSLHTFPGLMQQIIAGEHVWHVAQ
jgi:two-component system cell cycle response regulator DivK